MPEINDLTINITLQTKAVVQQGFGVPLILGSRETGNLVETYHEIAELAEMITAGFTADDAEYKIAAGMLAQSPRPEKIAVYVRDADDSIATALPELVETHNDWYALLITERDKTSLAAAGTAAAALEKIFIGCTADTTALAGRNNIREMYVIHPNAAAFEEAPLVGLCLPQNIGSYTWKWKTPSGITEAAYTLTELTGIRTAKGVTYCKRSGVIYSNEGITTGGEYLDIIQSRDYIKARLGEDIFALMINSKKVPFDNTGIARIEAVVRSRLKQCGSQGIIARAVDEADQAKSDDGMYMFKVSVPARADIPENDRAARKLTGIVFSLTIAGAVHNVDIDGYITV